MLNEEKITNLMNQHDNKKKFSNKKQEKEDAHIKKQNLSM